MPGDASATVSVPDGKGGWTPPVPLSAVKTAVEQLVKDRPGKRLKSDPEFDGAADKAYGLAAEDLRAFVDRIRRLQQHKVEIGDDIKAVFAEAKGRGYDVKALRYVVKWLDADRAAQAEFEAVVEIYKSALGVS